MTIWPQNQYGTSLTQGEQVYEGGLKGLQGGGGG